MTAQELRAQLERELEYAQSQFESEFSGTSDDSGARLVGAAVIASGLRIQLGLAQLTEAILRQEVDTGAREDG